MDPEKGNYQVDTDPPSNGYQTDDNQRRKSSIGLAEAADLYGDVQVAEQYGYVARGLKSRHIQFIALGGTIGTGLFIGIGQAFATAGPLSVLLGYSLTGLAIYAMMQALGEMATWLPLPGAIPQYCARYVDPAVGFATGWNNWYSNALTLCTEISAASLVIGYWNDTINQAAWITIMLVLVLCLNIFTVNAYGEAEFIFASVKIVTMIGLLILALIIDVGGVPGQERLGFRYWKHPWAPMLEFVGTGATGRFTGFFNTLANAAFAYGGVEVVAVSAGEARDPRRNIPKAVRRVFWRILFFYVLGSLAIGVTVPADNRDLLDGGNGAGSSPWVLAINGAGIPALPSIINAVILTSAASSANAFLYVGSRYLFALAQNKQAPKQLLYCTKSGVPIWCVLITASIGLLTYMTVSAGAANVFGWFQTLTALTAVATWISILVAYLQFRKALAAQGVNRDKDLVYRSRFQPYSAWFAIIFFAIIMVFNGFKVFTHDATTGKSNWNAEDFVTAYIAIPVYFAFYLFWKFYKRSKFINPAEADIWTGKAALDAEVWPIRRPRNLLERIWYWIA